MPMLLGFQCIVTGLLGEMLSAQRPEASYLVAEPSGAAARSPGERDTADSRTLRSLAPCGLAGLDPHSIFDRFFVRE